MKDEDGRNEDGRIANNNGRRNMADNGRLIDI